VVPKACDYVFLGRERVHAVGRKTSKSLNDGVVCGAHPNPGKNQTVNSKAQNYTWNLQHQGETNGSDSVKPAPAVLGSTIFMPSGWAGTKVSRNSLHPSSFDCGIIGFKQGAARFRREILA
jgi:hypothetical protein